MEVRVWFGLHISDLLQVIPAYRDGLGPNANEIIALRCLEDLFSSPKGITGAHGHKVEFDISENCYNVLQRTLQEVRSTFGFSHVMGNLGGRV